MQVIATALPDVLVFEPTVFGDARGFFYESFNRRSFLAALTAQAAGPRTAGTGAAEAIAADTMVADPGAADPDVSHGLHFVQDNHSRSAQNVLRGLHYQIRQPQGKLVRVIAGEVYDVAVDLRRSSPNFGKWVGMHLSGENRRQVWIPPGFGHGFVVLSEHAEFVYKSTDYWAPEHERCIAWNDPAIGIDWPIDGAPVLSAKDQQGVLLADAEVFE
jgi:dTDP-4-dehydrorhamnose 3,5-epimerase